MRRTHRFVLVLLASACGLGAIAATVACITAPPPDLPIVPLHRPTILHDNVTPPTDEVLTVWPQQWLVPVEVDDPSDTFWFDVFVDPDVNPDPAFGPVQQQPSPTAMDGGLTVVRFGPLSQPDPSFCHRVKFEVAHSFSQTSPPIPDSIGGDSVVWFYNPGGGLGGCPEYDAGALQDGAFPPGDAPIDGLPVVPDAGGDP